MEDEKIAFFNIILKVSFNKLFGQCFRLFKNILPLL